MPSPLPEFDKPPLDEVVFGVTFLPLKRFAAGHIGAYWSKIRDNYPHTEDNPALPRQVEQPDAKPRPFLKGGTELVAIPFPIRSWFLNKDRTELIQLQPDQFYRNWRQTKGTEVYPRFPVLYEAFKREWLGFRSFVQREQLGEITIEQYELTYVNQIPRGEGWENFSDLTKVFTVLGPHGPDSVFANPDLMSWNGSFPLPDGRGRVRAELAPVFRARDLKMVLSLTLSARGAPPSDSADQMATWFHTAHERIVRGFAELTTPAMHELWERRS